MTAAARKSINWVALWNQGQLRWRRARRSFDGRVLNERRLLIIAVVAGLWFVVDSLLSVATGFWRNAIPNTVLLGWYLLLVARLPVAWLVEAWRAAWLVAWLVATRLSVGWPIATRPSPPSGGTPPVVGCALFRPQRWVCEAASDPQAFKMTPGTCARHQARGDQGRA